MIWCDKCRKRHNEDEFTILKTVKGKTGTYQPYVYTLETECYTYTEVTRKCNVCGEVITIEEDEVFHKKESRMQSLGYRNSHYDT